MRTMFFTAVLLFLFATPTPAQQLWPTRFIAGGGNQGPFQLIDYDEDGDPDLLTKPGPLRVYANNYPGPWSLVVDATPGAGLVRYAVAIDVDGDGDLDYIASNTSDQVYWFEYVGQSQFVLHLIAQNVGGDISAGDIDGDGDNDFVVGAGVQQNGVSLWLNDGSGNFTGQDIPFFSNNASELSNLADINGDGVLDFAATELSQLNVFLSQGGPVYELLVLPNLGYDPNFQPPLLFDYDHDGDVDMIVSEQHFDDPVGGRRVIWYENVDNGSSLDVHVLWNGYPGQPRAIAALDVDLDGDTDFAYGDLLLINAGDNLTFSGRAYSEGNNDPWQTQLEVADIDGDGDMDILNQEVRWFVNPYISRRIEIGLDAMQTNVPANGGFITYHGALLNNMANPRYLRLWSTVTFPGGNESTVWSMRRVFQPGRVYEADTIQQYIPPAAPPGTYTFTVHFGDPDQLDVIGDSFQFVKHE